ncbi:MAG: CSLREA domain-containing protein, partial [Myxococcales bacterium]|nr:CSLREA domain-containing protein [Myxococcales bacterium]
NGVDDDLDGLVDGADPDCVGATFVVNSTSDDAVPSPNPCFTGGVCTLRAAIVAANSDLAADTIVVPDGTYELGMAGRNEDAGLTGDLDVTGPVVIEGAGAGATVIDARGIDRVLSVLGPGDPAARCQAYCAQFPDRCDECLPDTLMRATLRGLTIRGGQAQGPGGGILSNNSRLRLEDARVEDCATEPSPFGYFHSGGGIDSTGELILVRSEIVRNRVGSPGEPSSAQNVGGGIHHSGFVGYTRFAGLTALEIRESVIAENYAPRGGGVAAFGSLPLRIVDSAIRGNRAADSGGIYAETYAIEIERSTIARNVADSVAGMYAWIFSDTSLPQDPAIPDVGRLNLRASSIVENASETGAGGLVILCDGSICEAAIENATISSNTVANPPAGFIGAGGLYLRAASGEVGPSTLSATLSHVTIAANAEGPNLPSVALLGDAFGFLDVTWSGAIADGACHLDPEVENASLGGNVERDAT